MSAAICQWFCTSNTPEGRKCCGMGTGLPELTSGTALVFFKHLGSMSFGALIIAICQTVRAIVLALGY